MMVMKFKIKSDKADPWPSPIVFHDPCSGNDGSRSVHLDGEHSHQIRNEPLRVFNGANYKEEYKKYYEKMPDFSRIHNPKSAGTCSEENETSCNCLAFQVRNHPPSITDRP